ncbi:TAF5-like RNA polymerase II p300/CBP-associated factor-associated factor subunit 5L [Araneus ventricosus]|uniref:TAF5-like RNA polymerase II p300/CBP-associated factor-associated factor subunit 5L n=1 Tax=Araneus ventricosus TaxID=182803 RepID=A0A4Y2F7X6_ARAVE|nr:TAF5-like RNA polymerase II p300/CBP-associated factor-associated factor subunit 5L [Araneus ventricosus]
MSSVHVKEGSNASSKMVTPDSSIDFSLVVKEYSGLITFVNETPPPGNHQLSHFLFPFYVYVYLFLLKNQKFKEAQRFISIYSRLFLNAEGYAEVVQDLVKFKTLEDFQDHSYLKNFCESEYGYKVKLSEYNLKLLKEYLEDTECRILSHILHRKFNIEVIGDQSNREHTTESSSIKKKESTIQRTENPENSLSTRSIDLKKTDNVIEDKISREDITESSSIKKKESTTQRTENSGNSSSTRSIDFKKTNNIIEDQSNHEHTTESLTIKKKELITQRTECSENSSSIRTIDIEKTNNVIENQSNPEHTTESLTIKKKELTSQGTESSESSSSIRSIDIEKTNNIIENQSNPEHTTEASSNKEKESTSQRIEISESNLLTRRVDVKETKNRFLSEIPCYHYTISCRKEQLCCVDINQKNTLLSCGFESSGIHIWNIDPNIVNKSVSKNLDANESKCLATNFSNNNASSLSLRCVLKGHSGGVYGLAYASGLLMSCSEDTTDCTARLWSFNRTTPLRIFVGHSSDVDHVRFHSNCRYLATASADKTIQLWAVEDGRSMRNFPGHDTHINSIAFSPDGKHIASADDSGRIKIWDLASGKLHSEIVAHSKKILSISYNTDSSLIASCGIDSFIKIWDVKHSLPMDEKGKSEVQATSLVDSHSVDSVPHYVGFRQKDFLISIGAQMMTEH